ncbi:hypothetical protein [Streptomyces sp. TRM64462]|uniref:hypothetical protein n=1 Tax=Streptomyces sp. TRM64462 TaxID=2741726 RepID=UPI0015864CF2|nr:hypothetical protein [Streptomyces sp. TRM64462]
MTNALRRTVGPVALTCCLALSLAACGGGREYTVPQQACGVPLDKKALDPFLVDGEEFKVRGDSLGDPKVEYPRYCVIGVDGSRVVGIHLYKEDELVDPMDDLWSHRFENREKVKDVPFGGLAAVGDRNAMVTTRCATPQANYLIADMSFAAKAGDDLAERRKDIEAFALGFVAEMKKELGCTK